MDDQAGRRGQHLAREGIVDGAVFPERRQQLVDHTVGQHPPDGPGFPLHRVQVATSVAAAERHTRNQVMEDEIVQDDDAGAAAESLDDPAVRRRIVADVIDGDIGPAP
jgi:hypothetical protein